VLGLGNEIVNDLERANDPKIAAQLLVAFLKDHELQILEALAADDLPEARCLVNGGSHGFERFEDAFKRGDGVCLKRPSGIGSALVVKNNDSHNICERSS
jgi:peptidoglycan L-alanyl-D-glutamate endopeptidase CwlK